MLMNSPHSEFQRISRQKTQQGPRMPMSEKSATRQLELGLAGSRRMAVKSTRSRFFGHLPRTLIDLNSSMSLWPVCDS